MEQGKRQIQISKVIKKEMTEIFAKEGLNIIGKGMLSISDVRITPDLYEARIYLSFFQIDDAEQLLKDIIARTAEWRGTLGNRTKNQLRRIPVLNFYKDDTLDHVFKMEALFAKLEEERKSQQ